MARITVEDCMDKVENRFELVHLSAKRAKQLLKGSKPLVRSTNREVVTALREIADSLVYFEKKEIIEKLEKLEKKDIPYQLSNFAP
ncbi:MAG: DNA-directed RNA polymerase subunit omega [Deltaproteobacteria bacterium]